MSMQEAIVQLLREHGNRLTRGELWEKLALPDNSPTDEYWQAEQALADQDQIERRRGRNGGIYLITDARRSSSELDLQKIVDEERRERHQYEPALKTILQNWVKQPGFKNVFGTITAAQGRRKTGGRWSRPDLVLCTTSEWLFSSRPEGDVRTIEIKNFESLDTLAVFEALSHKMRSHYSYLLVTNFPKALDRDQEADFEAILAVAARHGVGVITARESADWSTWEFEIDARKSDADSQAINQMLLDQVPPEIRDSFQRSLRTITVTV